MIPTFNVASHSEPDDKPPSFVFAHHPRLKVGDDRIVIIKGLPVLQCDNCTEYVIEDAVMERVDTILRGVEATVELETLSYVA